MVEALNRHGAPFGNARLGRGVSCAACLAVVNSRILGGNSIDRVGPNAGFYQRATAAEICDYYQRVLEEHLLASGQVRFFGMSDWPDEGPAGAGWCPG